MDNLERKCTTCDGKGGLPNTRYEGFIDTCKDCSGNGYVLLPEGEQLLAFLNRWLVFHKGECESCNGRGRGERYSGSRYCSSCNGLRVKTNDIGSRILDLIDRDFAPLMHAYTNRD